MADRGVKIFGVETISPDLVYLTDEYPTHKACAERGLTHYENLNNLEGCPEPALPVRRLPAAARGRVRLARPGRGNHGGAEMSSTLLNRTTATKENALTEAEREAFLTDLRIGRLATMREDGWPHVTPIWYVWEDGRFVLSLGKSRRHLRNIARDPHVTLCVDEDPRTTDLTKSPQAVVCFGLATLHARRPDRRETSRRRSKSATCRRRRAGRSSTSCSGSRAASRSRSSRSAGSPGTRARGSSYRLDVIVDALGRGAEHVDAAVLRDHPAEQREPAGAVAERVGRQPHVPRRDRLEPVALELGRLAASTSRMQK